MTHDVRTLFYRGNVWHGIGNKIPDEHQLSIEQALLSAGANFHVSKKPLFLENEVPVDKFYATVRDDTSEVLGVVSKNYEVLQNIEQLEFFRPFLEQGCKLEVGGVLTRGRVFFLADINRDPIELTQDDIVRKYLLLSNSHSGESAVACALTPVRVVCANTLAMALGDKRTHKIRIRHSKSVLENLKNVQQTIDIVDQTFKAEAELYKKLLNKFVNAEDVAKFVVRVLDMESEDGTISTRAANQLEKIVGLFEKGIGNDLKGVRGTMWAGYNALTQYLSWEASRSDVSRYDSLWFGQNHAINEKALSLALELSA